VYRWFQDDEATERIGVSFLNLNGTIGIDMYIG
jgi:hypothetical protein